MSLNSTTIYLVEDDESFRKSLKRLISVLGFNVQEFNSAISFLQQSYFHRPSCLILDVNLPQMDGFSLQEELAIKGINIPIIFISGYRDNPKRLRAKKYGAIDFLQKPFSAQEIGQAIAKAIVLDTQHTRVGKSFKKSLKALLDKCPIDS